LCHTGLVWESAIDGRRTDFHLAGINNQNFLMQDDQTGSWWQQISGEAILGPLAGRRLRLLPADEVSFAIWRREHPGGRVLRPAADPAWRAFSEGWEEKTARLPVVGPYAAPGELAPRALVVGVEAGGAAKAYPFATLAAGSPLVDTLGGVPVVVLVAEDGRSVRAFEAAQDGRRLTLYAPASAGPAPGARPRQWLDGETGSRWDFAGRCVAGALAGRRLRQIPALKDYWFDWRAYHPDGQVYRTLPGSLHHV
jgi:hypothetical protein